MKALALTCIALLLVVAVAPSCGKSGPLGVKVGDTIEVTIPGESNRDTHGRVVEIDGWMVKVERRFQLPPLDDPDPPDLNASKYERLLAEGERRLNAPWQVEANWLNLKKATSWTVK